LPTTELIIEEAASMTAKTKVSGTVGRSDLEGGFWTFETEAGDVYKLEGGGADLLKSGVRAEIEGSVDEGGMGIGFGAPIFVVGSYKIKR
jgi:hypothetical protein